MSWAGGNRFPSHGHNNHGNHGHHPGGNHGHHPPGGNHCPPSAPPSNPHCPTANPGYSWVKTNTHANVPSTAVKAGQDTDGSTLYVGRAHHCGDWLPAKVVPSRREAYISFEGKEVNVQTFEILCEQTFRWVRARGGQIPAGAVAGGKTAQGEVLYVGRAKHLGRDTNGKVHGSHGCCYIPFGGVEHRYNDYEVLVLKS